MYRKISLKTFVNLYQKRSKHLLQKIIFDKKSIVSEENAIKKFMIKMKINNIKYILLKKKKLTIKNAKKHYTAYTWMLKTTKMTRVENKLYDRYVGGAKRPAMFW